MQKTWTQYQLVTLSRLSKIILLCLSKVYSRKERLNTRKICQSNKARKGHLNICKNKLFSTHNYIFKMKNSWQTRTWREHFNLAKVTYQELNRDSFDATHLKSGIGQRCPTGSHCGGNPATATEKEKEKDGRTEVEVRTVIVCGGCNHLHRRTNTKLWRIREFSKVSKHKIYWQNPFFI